MRWLPFFAILAIFDTYDAYSLSVNNFTDDKHVTGRQLANWLTEEVSPTPSEDTQDMTEVLSFVSSIMESSTVKRYSICCNNYHRALDQFSVGDVGRRAPRGWLSGRGKAGGAASRDDERIVGTTAIKYLLQIRLEELKPFLIGGHLAIVVHLDARVVLENRILGHFSDCVA